MKTADFEPNKWAKVTYYSTLLFLLLLVVLHIIKSELDPTWRMISEYALGKNGWIMVLAFLVWALSFISLFFAIRSYIQKRLGKLGLIALWISALGILIAAIFITDPVTASPEEITTSGMLHNLGGTLGMAMPLATILVGLSLMKNPEWANARRPVYFSTGLTLIGFLVSFISLGVFLSETNGVFNETTPVGIPMRFEVVSYCIWY